MSTDNVVRLRARLTPLDVRTLKNIAPFFTSPAPQTVREEAMLITIDTAIKTVRALRATLFAPAAIAACDGMIAALDAQVAVMKGELEP